MLHLTTQHSEEFWTIAGWHLYPGIAGTRGSPRMRITIAHKKSVASD